MAWIRSAVTSCLSSSGLMGLWKRIGGSKWELSLELPLSYAFGSFSSGIGRSPILLAVLCDDGMKMTSLSLSGVVGGLLVFWL